MNAATPPNPQGNLRTPIFATTRWTQVLAAAETRSPDGLSALNELCRTYWYPLYAYARRSGVPPETAQDLTQAFFAELIEKKVLKSADAGRGRFRTFLLSCFQNFIKNRRRDAQAQKRGGGDQPFSLEAQDAEGRFLHEPSHADTPEVLYEKKWAQSFVNRVLELLRAEYVAAGAGEKFDAMSLHIVEPEAATAYAPLARKLGTTEGALKTAMHRLRRRYRELFRDELTLLLGDEADLEDELRHMAAVLAR